MLTTVSLQISSIVRVKKIKISVQPLVAFGISNISYSVNRRGFAVNVEFLDINDTPQEVKTAILYVVA